VEPATDLVPFRDEIISSTPGGERLLDCIQCGTCGGSCPNGDEMDHTPRKLFAMIGADMRQEVLTADAPWMCVSCYLCGSRCPQNIPITEIMYTIKRKSIAGGWARHRDGPALARAFTELVDQYGRSFELGLASRFYLSQKPASLLRMGPLGMSLFKRGRISLMPTRIKAIGQLRAIIEKAKELGGAS
jgi:heterodisulfide reductase subunit C/quinone-modifying oxidoreductase subunit QmoC